jgi:hypothetical protein
MMAGAAIVVSLSPAIEGSALPVLVVCLVGVVAFSFFSIWNEKYNNTLRPSCHADESGLFLTLENKGQDRVDGITVAVVEAVEEYPDRIGHLKGLDYVQIRPRHEPGAFNLSVGERQTLMLVDRAEHDARDACIGGKRLNRSANSYWFKFRITADSNPSFDWGLRFSVDFPHRASAWSCEPAKRPGKQETRVRWKP